MKVRFVLVCEGASDAGLVPHLQVLCVHCGASEAIGISPDFMRLPKPPGGALKSRLEAALALEPSAHLAFVHRDADSRDETPRIDEINVAAAGLTITSVPIVPVQATESWLLLDEIAIRSVVENPRGTVSLNLPAPHDVERMSNPKQRLKEVLSVASELRGRRLVKFKKAFGQHRAILLERLDATNLAQVPAWQRLVERTSETIRGLRP